MNEASRNHAFCPALSSSQRAKLKGLAHSLKPLVQVGGEGLSTNVKNEIKKALEIHELIKVQLPGQTKAADKKGDTDELSGTLPAHAHLVHRIGRTLILYLEKSPDNAKIKLSDL